MTSLVDRSRLTVGVLVFSRTVVFSLSPGALTSTGTWHRNPEVKGSPVLGHLLHEGTVLAAADEGQADTFWFIVC